MPLSPTSLGFKKFLLHETGWHTAWNDNADLMDSLLSGSTPSGGLEIRGAAGSPGVLDLTTAELTVVDGDKLGQINFRAPLESSATDAILNGVSIYAEADATFTSSVNSTDLVIALGTSEAAAEKARFTHEGQLGIGTATPEALLHVESGAGTAPSSIDAGTMAIIQRNASTGNGVALSLISGTGGDCALNFGDSADENDGAIIYDQAANTMAFRANAATKMTLNQDGKLGIGTTGPEVLLHIESGAGTAPTLDAATVGIFQRNASTYQDCAISIIAKANANSIVNFSDEASENPGSISYDHGSGNLSFRANANTYWVMSSLGGFICGSPTGGDKGASTINAVGVYDDNVLLTDYVFEPGYDLMPLADMESFFRTHNHLPTIQGKAEWDAAGGFSLGHLSTMLWETAEVHALYIAELQARIAKLEE